MSSRGFKPTARSRAKSATRSMSRAATLALKRVSRQGVPASRGAMQRKGELKFVDMAETTVVLDTTGAVTLLSPPVPGSLETNRIGRKIMLKSLHFTGRIVVSGLADATVMEYLRIMIIYDRQTNGAGPAIADVLQAVDNAGGLTSTAMDGLNISNAERFKVLRDWRVAIGGTNGAIGSTAGSTALLQCFPGATKDGLIGGVCEAFIKLNGLETHFNTGVAGTVADISTGGLFILTLGKTAAATAPYKLIFTTRKRYWDH